VERIWSWCAPHVTWLWECGPVLCTISVCFAVVHNSYSEASCCSLQVKSKTWCLQQLQFFWWVWVLFNYVYANVVSDSYFFNTYPQSSKCICLPCTISVHFAVVDNSYSEASHCLQVKKKPWYLRQLQFFWRLGVLFICLCMLML
jgi:hypothetical protein